MDQEFIELSIKSPPNVPKNIPKHWFHVMFYGALIAKEQCRSYDALQTLVFWQNISTKGDSSDQRN